MGKVRGELEDLAFQHLEPDAYREILQSIESRRHSNEEFLDEIRQTVDTELRHEGIPARIDGRVKRPYSVFQKLRRQKITVNEVYDLMALRIVTDSVKNCYAALGVIHNKWRPIPGRIKDFIAIPRPNLYQSLHTSVVGPHGQTFEVQIRTEEMHRIAEEGIAAHWKYKEGRKGPAADDQRIAWLRHLVEWQRDVQDPAEFMSTLKVDLYPEEVYTFTPRGKVIVLPRDATPIDFAYAIHSDVGHTCVGAKVNGRIVPLRSALRNGDVVEIMTQPNHEPSKDWLAFVKTSRARNKIKHVINASERLKAIEIGQKYLEKEARRLGVQFSKIGKADLEAVASDYGLSKAEDLYAALGYGKFSARQVLEQGRSGLGKGRAAGRQARRRGSQRAGSGARHNAGKAARRRLGHPGARNGRLAGVPRQMLQPHPRRSHRRLRHSREGRGGPFEGLPQRPKPDVRRGAEDRGRVGTGRRGRVPGPYRDPDGRPSRNAQPAHLGAFQREH